MTFAFGGRHSIQLSYERFQDKEQNGQDAAQLKPMLVALDELIPWLLQWHNYIDPEYGDRLGDYYAGFLLEELRQLDLSRDELTTWEAPIASRRKRQTKT